MQGEGVEVSPRVNKDMHEALHRNSEEIFGPWHKQPSSVQLYSSCSSYSCNEIEYTYQISTERGNIP